MIDNYNRVEDFEKITQKMLDLYKKKNSDYGNSVAKTFDEWGLTSFLVRMEDKMNRIINLTKKSGWMNSDDIKVQDEKIEDTLMDLANYSIMAMIEMNRVRKNVISNELTNGIISVNDDGFRR